MTAESNKNIRTGNKLHSPVPALYLEHRGPSYQGPTDRNLPDLESSVRGRRPRTPGAVGRTYLERVANCDNTTDEESLRTIVGFTADPAKNATVSGATKFASLRRANARVCTHASLARSSRRNVQRAGVVRQQDNYQPRDQKGGTRHEKACSSVSTASGPPCIS